MHIQLVVWLDLVHWVIFCFYELVHWCRVLPCSQILIRVNNLPLTVKLDFELLRHIYNFNVFFRCMDGTNCRSIFLSSIFFFFSFSLIGLGQLIPVWVFRITKNTYMLLQLLDFSVENLYFISLWFGLFYDILKVFVSYFVFISLSFDVTFKFLVRFSRFNVKFILDHFGFFN